MNTDRATTVQEESLSGSSSYRSTRSCANSWVSGSARPLVHSLCVDRSDAVHCWWADCRALGVHFCSGFRSRADRLIFSLCLLTRTPGTRFY
jgi:hypothetical protein